jgi:hypothetical protein
MQDGVRLSEPPPLEAFRARARAERDRLPRRAVALEPADPPYPVAISTRLAAWRDTLTREPWRTAHGPGME